MLSKPLICQLISATTRSGKHIYRLMDADVPENYVAQLSGHKNLKSLDDYKTASASHRRNMSMVLSRSGMVTSAVNGESRSLQKYEASIVTSQSGFQEQDVSFTNRSAVEGVFSECTIKIIEGCTFNVFLNPATSKDQVRVSTRNNV